MWWFGGLLSVCAANALSEDYMARIDPSLRSWLRSVRLSEDVLLQLEVHQGKLRAFQDHEQLALEEEEVAQLRSVFPSDAFAPEALLSPIGPEAWDAKRQQFGKHGLDANIFPDCAVNNENHLERTTVAVFNQLKSSHLGVVVTVGGLYGHRHGEGEDVLDDPAIELLLEMQRLRTPALRALCLGCEEEQVASLTRARSLQEVFRLEALEETSLRSALPDISLPKDFIGPIDLLRLDALPHGSSCQVLRSLLLKVQPRLVAMFVFSQVPPPFEFIPHSQSVETPPALMACSLSAAMQVLAPHNIFLIHLTGPYALFVHREEWHQALPIDEMDCYRKSSAWGMQDIPIDFVREWFFEDVDKVLPRIWSNISSLNVSGQGMFTLGLQAM